MAEPTSITTTPASLSGNLAPEESKHQPYVPDTVNMPEFTWTGRPARRWTRHPLRRLVAVSAAQGRHDRVGVGAHRRAVDHAVPRLLAGLRLSPGDHPGKQHRADDRLGRRVDRLRRRRHHAGAAAARLRDGRGPRHDRVGAGRTARHPHDDPAAAGLHRQAAWQADLSRGDGLRRSAGRRREGRGHGAHGLRRLRHRARAQVLDQGVQALGRRAGTTSLPDRQGRQIRPAGRRGQRRVGAGVARRRLPDRAAHRLADDRRRLAIVLRDRPAHRHLRRQAPRAGIAGQDADPRHGTGRLEGQLPALHRRRRRGGRRHHQHDAARCR